MVVGVLLVGRHRIKRFCVGTKNSDLAYLCTDLSDIGIVGTVM